MANEGFKGEQILIDRMAIDSGPGGVPVLSCSVQFAGADGTVHAVATHKFLLDAEVSTDGIAAAANELMRLVVKRVEAMHFVRPNDTESQVLKGIAETLRSTSQPPDEPGTQG
jgi:hypothetical protein